MDPRWTALAVAMLAAATARAADPADGEVVQGEVLLEEIEVKSSRPARVDTLEVREVRETPARDLGEALEQQLGLGKVRKAGIANDLVLRGMKRDDVAVVVDGSRVHGACPSRMDPPSFHLDYAEVDRVEVRRGPFDVRQPGGLGGVVEVRTRGSGRGAGAELNLGAGESGAMESSAVVSYGAERAGLLLGGSFKQGQPYTAGDGSNLLEAATGTGRYRSTSSDRTAYDVRTGWARVDLAPADGHRVELAYTHQAADDVLYPFLLMDGLTDDTDRVNATWRLEEADGLVSGALGQVYWSGVDHLMDDRGRCSSAADPTACTGALPRAYSMSTRARSTIWGGKLEATTGRQEALAVTVGADASLRNWDNTTTRVMRAQPGQPYATEASIPDVTTTMVGAYAQLTRPLVAGLRATAGARLDLAGSRADVDRSALHDTFSDAPGARDRTDVLLAGNVQLDWDAGGGASFFLGYGHGTRVPDPQERYMALTGMTGRPAWVGNPALEPVRSDEVDLGAKLVAGGLLVKAQGYHAWVEDHVTLASVTVTPDGGAPLTAKTYRNVSARLLGGEASARLALPARLYASAAVTYTRGENASAGTPLAEIPPLRGSVALRWDTGRFFVEAEEQWAARQGRVDPALEEEPTRGWFITNLKAGAEWRGLKVFAGVRNLLDRYYVEHLSYQRDPFAAGVKVPEPGRTLYSNVQYRF